VSAGIVSFGAYVPPTRLALSTIGGRAARDGEPEKAVAWNDEDSLTMAVAAAQNALRDFDRAGVDGLLLASTTHPFREKQGAALVARALDLRRDLRTADFGGSLRAGVQALRAAFDAVASGSARRVLVVASDCRMGAPGSALERSFGDGAAAFLVGDADAVALFEDAYAVADEIVDVWRGERDRFVHSWEERFVLQEGFQPSLLEAVRGLLARGSAIGDFARLVVGAPDARSLGGALRALGADPARAQDLLFGRLGHAGGRCGATPATCARATWTRGSTSPAATRASRPRSTSASATRTSPSPASSADAAARCSSRSSASARPASPRTTSSGRACRTAAARS
jgi:hydroxymethylglutaryl-CoA synthase